MSERSPEDLVQDHDHTPFDIDSESRVIGSVHDESLEFDPFGDTDESVARYIGLEFTSAIETEEKEAAIERLMGILPEQLKKFGLEKPATINHEAIDELMGYGFEDEEDIENLYYKVWDIAREEFGPFSRVRFDFMMDAAQWIDSDELMREQDNRAIHELIELGVDQDAILDMKGNAQERRKLRRMNWVLENEPSLHELVTALKKSKLHGASILPEDLALHIGEYLERVSERLKSMDPNKMDSIDRVKHQGQCHIVEIGRAHV